MTTNSTYWEKRSTPALSAPPAPCSLRCFFTEEGEEEEEEGEEGEGERKAHKSGAPACGRQQPLLFGLLLFTGLKTGAKKQSSIPPRLGNF